mmetsp:Transcript_51690/g.145191  ORF Transcript_51690/g.145191 Transcript_51690/m.145191 type:complete len:203 (+) Transcript_51690:628-1236(+)
MIAAHSLRCDAIRGPYENDMRRKSRKSKTSVVPKSLVPSLPPTTMRRCSSTRTAEHAPLRILSGGPLTQDIAEDRNNIGLKFTNVVVVTIVRVLPVSNNTAPGCCRLRLVTRSSSMSARFRLSSAGNCGCCTRKSSGCFLRCCPADAKERRRARACTVKASRSSSDFGSGSTISTSGSSLSGGRAMAARWRVEASKKRHAAA